MTRVIEGAVGDDIKRDVRENQLVTQNSTPARIWDHLNTSIAKNAEKNGCLYSLTKRGPWNMIIIYDNESKYVITIMREERLKEIRKGSKKRKSLHYLQAFTQCYNRDLYADGKQQSMFEEETALNDVYKDAENIVQKMIESINSTKNHAIARHVLVLFSSMNYQLTNIRAVMIDTDLDIVCEESWNKYISTSESIITDIVSPVNDKTPYNKPSHGMKFTSKANERKANSDRFKEQSRVKIRERSDEESNAKK